MAALASKNIEKQVLYSLCESPKKARNYLLSRLDGAMFHTPSFNKAWRRISTMMAANGGNPPRWEILCEDSALDDTTRSVLSKVSVDPITSKVKADEYVTALHDFKTRRELFSMSEYIEELLAGEDQEGLNTKDIVGLVQAKVNNLSLGSMTAYKEYSLVKGDGRAIVDRILSATKPDLILTGFSDFDKMTGGLPWGGVTLMAGTTGGGKSNLSMNAGMNMAGVGHDVTYIPLEMSEDELYKRMLAREARIKYEKIHRAALTEGERKKVDAAFEKFMQRVTNAGGDFNLWCPDNDVSITECLSYALSKGSRIVIIDYVSLLAGLDGDDAWKKISAVGRIAKLWAKANNAHVVLLAQLSEEGMVRYSKGIVEHATTGWTWVRSADSEEDEIEIRQIKARGHSPAPFRLTFDLEYCYVGDKNSSPSVLNHTGLDDEDDAPKKKRRVEAEEHDDGSSEVVVDAPSTRRSRLGRRGEDRPRRRAREDEDSDADTEVSQDKEGKPRRKSAWLAPTKGKAKR